MISHEWVPPSARELKIMVRNYIELYPDRHNQGVYFGNPFLPGYPSRLSSTLAEVRAQAFQPLPESPADPVRPVCGTTACVAGWAIIFGEDPAASLHSSWDFLNAAGEVVDAHERAGELLGLDEEQAGYLFYEARTRAEVLVYLTRLIEDAAALPPSDDDWE